MSLAEFTRRAATAWNLGHSHIVARLNGVAKSQKLPRIKADAPEAGTTFDFARVALLNALDGIRPYWSDLDARENLKPWLVSNDQVNEPLRISDDKELGEAVACLVQMKLTAKKWRLYVVEPLAADAQRMREAWDELPGRLGAPIDEENYMPAAQCRTEYVDTHAKLLGVLKKKKIHQRRRARRLYVHAGQWAAYVASEKTGQREPTDEEVEKYLAGVEKRTSEARAGRAVY